MRRHSYTQEECDFLRNNILNMSYTELQRSFNKKFGVNLAVKAILHKCQRLGINHGKSHLRMAKGEKNPFSLTLPIGSEVISAGKVYIKVSDNPITSGKQKYGSNSNYIQKNRYIYEQTYGKIPDGYLVVSLVNDKMNFEPQNLYAVPRKINLMMCANKWYKTDRDETLTAIKWCELFYALKDHKRKDGQNEKI